MVLIQNQELELQYKKGNGAWTYHLIIPNTAKIEGKWGSLKVSGQIDNYKIDELNLAPRRKQDKMISVNKDIRKAIQKSAGDKVNVTLYLVKTDHSLNEATILKCFKDAGVLHILEEFPESKTLKIILEIRSKPSEEKQIEKLNYYISLFLEAKK